MQFFSLPTNDCFDLFNRFKHMKLVLCICVAGDKSPQDEINCHDISDDDDDDDVGGGRGDKKLHKI